MTLTRADLADILRTQFGFSRGDAKDLVDHFFEEIVEALQQGESVKLSGLGVFSLRSKNARLGRNPKTGEEVMIQPRTVMRFRAGNKLRSRINERESKERTRDFDLIAE